MKKIAVGTKNKPKLDAARSAFEKVWPEETWEIIGVEVESGVPNQPMSDEESIVGARNRAQQALEKSGADYGVGIEGGIHELEGKHFVSGWMVVLDKTGREGIGSSTKIIVPRRAVEMIKKGMELGEVTDVLFDKTDSKHQEGYYGEMTKNLVTRATGYRDGIIVALTRFVHPHLFD